MRSKTSKIFYYVAFAAIAVMLFAKCRFGFPSDEALYLLVPYRFINGDIPILHEWHPTQISNIWIQPLVALVLKLNEGTTGIFLLFRYIFTGIWCIASLFLYLRLRKIDHTGAIAASLIFMVYVPYGEMALYYNTIALMTLTSSLVIIATAEKFIPLQMIIAGFLLALAVTCCPFLAPVFILLIILIKGWKSRLSFAGGTVAAALIFLICVTLKANIKDVISSIKYLAGDREHPVSFFTKITSYFTSVFSSSILTPLVLALFVILVIYIKYKKDDSYVKAGFIATMVLVLFWQISFILMNDYVNNYMLAPGLIGLYCFINSRDEAIRNLFKFCWIPGLIYTLCINFSSNLGYTAIASAGTVMTVVSCVMAARFIMLTKLGRTVVIIAIILGVFQFGVVFNKRMNYVFSESNISTMTETCEIGSMKGLRISESRLYYYKYMLNDILPIIKGDYDKILILSPESWLYLDADKDIGSYTCWSPIIDEYTIELLEEYYGLYPDMMPDAVYVESYYSNLVPYLNEWGYVEEETPLGGYILTKCANGV